MILLVFIRIRIQTNILYQISKSIGNLFVHRFILIFEKFLILYITAYIWETQRVFQISENTPIASPLTQICMYPQALNCKRIDINEGLDVI